MIPLRRILLSRTDRLGDVILATPAATALKQQLPGVEVFFLARRYTAGILELHPHVDGIISLDEQGAVPLAGRLAAHRFDAVVALFPRPQLAWRFLQAGIPLRIGTGYRWYSVLYNRRVYQHRRHARQHEAECNLQLLAPLGITTTAVEFHYRRDPAVEREVTDLLAAQGVQAGFVVLHPGSGGSARDWPPEHFAALARQVVTVTKRQVVLTGHASERELTRQIRQASGGNLIDLAGHLTLKQLAGVLARAAVFVGNSSGPLHLARMVGTPVVAFYPPITACRPERWGPYGCRADVLMSQQEECFRCRKSRTRVCPCMQAIPVAEAFRKVEEKLS
ncbi:MAG: glycosyltransferase family 9 protein [candidate division KSB1 bacterium]|nr:glycosyltransferase family 9 protein [candidate division KSB1 bacterium]MDZ7275724.1 glycosyltransferase family 9 protein [candidate division KSB1 bacterium]MDZ7284585.1 glycosyltransferase family 9 protein [candidate division KSB1 bacterium]MDZ7297996.1 glycosyltransferase family 9 protein [candidate division KSB1 bacterium]MDZ7305836.1 glycosyltransferase family 9 protein [candidate division KSB1 bacterium]